MTAPSTLCSPKVTSVLPRPRRAASLAASVLLLTSLAACGGDTAEEDEGLDRLSSVTIDGEPGKAPKVAWKDQMTADGIEVETLVEGDGPEVATGETVTVHYWIGNGFTQRKTISTYDKGGAPQQITVDDQLAPIFGDALTDVAVGSRVASTASAEEAFGPEGNPGLGIGNSDTVLVVMDVIEIYTPPKAVDTPAAELPKPVFEKGDPVRFDFSGVPEPKADGKLLRTILKEGTGAALTPEMTVTADYLGSVYDAKGPFDESYSAEPVPFPLTDVVQGWTIGLTGVKVGSRVLLQIPPDLGYGSQAQDGIPAGSTLYFVIDIVSAT